MRRTLLSAVGVLAMLFAGQHAASAAETSDEAQIRELVKTELAAGASHDIDKVMSVYWNSKDFVLFDAGPHVVVGYDALKAAWLAYFKAFPKAESSLDDLHVGFSGDVGYAFSLQTWKFHKPDGTVRTDVHRVTSIYKKVDGRWLCVHENDSIPSNINVPL
jgi:uncharacterized protein (TIGR02246 family)